MCYSFLKDLWRGFHSSIQMAFCSDFVFSNTLRHNRWLFNELLGWDFVGEHKWTPMFAQPKSGKIKRRLVSYLFCWGNGPPPFFGRGIGGLLWVFEWALMYIDSTALDICAYTGDSLRSYTLLGRNAFAFHICTRPTMWGCWCAQRDTKRHDTTH